MAAAQSIICTICDLRHNTFPAIVWCPECDENLCGSCKEHHDLTRLTKGHQSIKIEECNKISPIIQEIKQYCAEHNEQFIFLCPSHGTLCCRKCITSTHSQCTKFTSLEDVIDSSKSSTSFQDIEQNLECQLSNLANAKNDRQGNKKLVMEQKEKFRNDIKNIRNKISEYLDQLEKKLVDEIDFSSGLQVTEIDKVIEEIEQKHQDVNNIKSDVINIKGKATDLQTFLGIQKIEDSVLKSEECIKAFIKSLKFDRISVEMNVSNDISTFLSKIKSLGIVRVVVKPPTISVLSKKEYESQLKATFTTPEIPTSDLTLRLSTKVQAPKGRQGINVTGCTVSPTGQIYVADFSPNKRILTVNNDGTYNKDINFVDSPVFDLTFIDSTHIAMSSGSYKGIKVFDINNQTVTRSTHTVGNIYGITSANGSLIYCVGNQNIQSLNLSDESVSDIESGKLKNNAYISYAEDRLYHTSCNGSAITCCNINGKIIWEFRTEKLQHPRGIAVDRKGRIYVVGEASNNVIQISPDGKHFTELLTKSHEIYKPSAICCDRKNENIAICNKNGCLFVYKIQEDNIDTGKS